MKAAPAIGGGCRVGKTDTQRQTAGQFMMMSQPGRYLFANFLNNRFNGVAVRVVIW